MNGDVFRAKHLVGDDLVSHEVETASTEHGAAGGVVVHRDRHRQIGRDDGARRMVSRP